MIKNKKLLFFVSEDWYFCSHRLPLAISAKNRGLDVALVTRVRDHGKIITESGIRIIPLEFSRKGMNPFLEIFTIIKLLQIYKTERPDILHHVALKPVLYGSLVAYFAGIKNVVNAIAGMGSIFISGGKRTKLLKYFVMGAFRFLLNREGSRLILQNPDDVKYFIQNRIIEPQKVALIRGSGVDLQQFYPIDNRESVPVVMLASRLLWDKGVGEFVEAIKLLKDQKVDARFILVVISDKDNPTAIPQDQIQTWHESGLIEWWGHQSDMPKVLNQAHIIVLPSYREGLPKVLLEAASCGLPLIATDVPGCREIVRHEENGSLVPVKDALALAKAIRELIENPEKRNRMGKAGRQIVEQEFSKEIVFLEILELYQSLLT